MSIGTLMAYTMVSLCVLILRYRFEAPSEENSCFTSTNGVTLVQKFFKSKNTQPTNFSSRLVNWLSVACVFYIISLCLILSKADVTKWYSLAIICILMIMLAFFAVLIWRQPQNSNITTFKVNLWP